MHAGVSSSLLSLTTTTMAGPLLQVVDARERVKSLLERGEPLKVGSGR